MIARLSAKFTGTLARLAGQKLEDVEPGPTSTLKHAATGLWKANDLADGLYTFSVGLGTRISEQFQLSFDVTRHLQNRPPTAATRKNDVALVTAITTKF